MPKKVAKPLKKITTRVFEEDYQELEKFSTPERTTQELLRDILHQFIVQAGARLRTKIDALESEHG